MIKSTFLKSWLLLLCMIVGSSAAWADEVFYTLDGSITGGTNGYATESEITQNSMTWMVTGNTTMNPWRIGGKNLTDENRPVYSTTAMATAISKVDLTVGTANLTVNSIKLIVASDADFSNKLDEISADFKASSTISFAPTTGSEWATGSYYKFIFNVTAGSSNQYVQLSKAEFYYKPSTPANKLESISLSGTYSTTFTEGDEFNHSGMIVTATYDDSSTKDVSSAATFSGYDMSTTGSQEVTVSYTEGEVTKTATYDITVNAIPTHKVTWSVNGSTTQETYKEGASITFPADPAEIEGKQFMGWVTTAISGTTNEIPSFVTSATMGTENVTYFAVFATVVGNLTSTIDELNREFTGVAAGSGYSDWTGKTGSSGAVYAGNSAGGSATRPAIQMRTNYSNSGIVTTTSGGNAQKVTIEWDTDTSNGRILDVYGNNTAYTAATDLYNSSKQGTKLGSFTYTEGGAATATLTINDDYEFIGIRSNNSPLYLKTIEITWESGSATISDYCTTVAADTRADAELSFTPTEVSAEVGKEFTKPRLNTADGFNGTVEYTSSDNDVARITDSENGDLLVVGEGEATITATFAGNDDFKRGSASYKLTVTDNRIATTITQEDIVLDIADVATLTKLAPVVKDASDNVISYTYEGFPPTVSFEQVADPNGIIGSFDWNSGEISLNQVVGTATIKATYNLYNVSSTYKPSECTFTITVSSALSDIASLTAETEAGTYQVKLDNAVVTYVNGNYAYIQDNTAAVVMYKSGHGLNAGDVLNGTATVTYQLRNNNPQITSLENVTAIAGTAPEPATVDAATWDYTFSDVLSQYFKVTGATLTQTSGKYYVELNGEYVQLYKAGSAISSLDLTKKYTIVGFPTLYNTTKELQLFADPEEEASTEPSITVADNEINVDAAEGDGTITVTYNNITTVVAEIKFCEADGTTSATYDWITAEINNENNIYYVISANTGEARTAYLKVYALDNDANDVYSELITITQAKYVAPDPTIVPVVAGQGCFVKVTDDADLTAGNYLIVYEGSSVAFDGGLDELDAVNDVINVTIANGKIPSTAATAAATFTIKPSNGTIQSASGHFIGFSGNNNGLKQSDDEDTYSNTFSIDSEDNAEIYANYSGSTMYLRFNKASNQNRFRYYKNAGQEAIQLYKYDATDNTTFNVDIDVTDARYATYCSHEALDFTSVEGLIAYKATIANNEVGFQPVTKVPAGEGVLLQLKENADAGTYNIPVIASAEAIENDFIGVLKETEITETGIFVLLNGGNGVGFYKTKSAFTVGAHTAYLPAIAGARDFIGIDDNTTTGVNSIDNGQWTIDNVYNLNGQRVNNAKKGLYIVNGKKVVIK